MENLNWNNVFKTNNASVDVVVYPTHSKELMRNKMIEHYANLIMNAKSKQQREIAINGYNAYSPVPFTYVTSFCKPNLRQRTLLSTSNLN